MEFKPFRFKQFTVSQQYITHKVGTDGVLLGAWVNIRKDDRFILDIGTGSGLIALMLAQRAGTGTHIDAIDIEALDVQQASANVARSPWPEKISLYHGPVQTFRPDTQYDLIVSNPPYFLNGQASPDKRRGQARHALQLSFEDLLNSVSQLLTPKGRFGVILPHTEGLQFLKLARTFKLFPIRKTFFRSRVNKPIERILLELAFEGTCEAETEIILYAEGRTQSAEYRNLTCDFYL